METTTKDLRVKRARQDIKKVIERHGLSSRDVGILWSVWGDDRPNGSPASDNLWESLSGMWKDKDIDPLGYQKKMRDELDRSLPPL